MPVPALVAALAPAAIQGLSGAAARLIGGKERIPNLLQPAINTSQQQLSDLEDAQVRNMALLEDRAARTGGSLTSAREDLLNANARGDATIRGGILDVLARARQQQELVNADAANRRRAGIIEGITGGGAAVAEGLGSFLDPVDTSPVNVGVNEQAIVSPQIGISPSTPTNISAVRPNLTAQVNAAINPANQLVELDFRPGQSLTNFSQPRASLASTMGTFANNFFTTLQ